MGKLDKAKQIIWAHIQLRSCTSLGRYPQVEGRVYVRNSGALHLGGRVRIRASHVPVELAVFDGAQMSIGDETFINSGVSICAQRLVSIGRNCRIGNYVLIMDSDFHVVGDLNAQAPAYPVVIEDDVWLGARSTILKGVTIGKGAVVAAGAVVTRDVPPATMVGGVPARILRHIDNAIDLSRTVEAALPDRNARG